MGVLKYFECSSVHVSQETATLLSKSWDYRRNLGWPPISIREYQEGWFIFVPEDEEIAQAQTMALLGEFPPELAGLLRLAFDKGCTLIQLDADALYEEGLPMFSW